MNHIDSGDIVHSSEYFDLKVTFQTHILSLLFLHILSFIP